MASTIEKAKTLKFQLLFGEWDRRVCRESADDVMNAIDYYFAPEKIFGIACHSYGQGFQSFHYAFVLRACSPCEIGNIVNSVVPGAEVLVKTSTSVSTSKLISLISVLAKNNVDPTKISLHKYRKLNYLLEEKISTDYFIGELIAEKNPY